MEEGITSIIELLSNGVDISALDCWPQTPVTYALKHACVVEVIRKLIERGANVNACDATGLTPLLHALQKRCSSVVINELIKHGANVNVCDGSQPALMYAMDMSEETALLLIDSGADVNACDNCDITCSMYALKNYLSENFVIKLLDNGTNVKDGFSGGTSFLMCALRYCYSTNIVSRIIKGGADVNAQDDNGRTPLMYALRNDCSNDVIMKLINCGSDVNKYDNIGKTCLMYAVRYMWNDNFGHLLKYGASVNACDNTGKTVLMYTIEHFSCLKYITEIISYGCNINVQDESGRSALMCALKLKSSNEIILKLLDSGADVNLFDNHGKTPLIESLINCYDISIVKKLIECTADDVSLPVDGGFSPIMYALIHYKYLDIASELLNRRLDEYFVSYVNYRKSCLIYAMEYHRNISVVNALLKHGAHLDVCDTDGVTPLLFSVNERDYNKRFVDELIKNGADTNVFDGEGRSLLMYALLFMQDKKDFILNLIDDIKDLNKKDARGRTCLMYALKTNADKDIVVKIIKNGGSVFSCNIKGESVWMYTAKYCRNEEVIQFLISECANINCIDNEGNTVLHCINASDSKLISLFFDSSVSINAENNNKQTPLMMAVLKNNKKLVKYLLSLGCNTNCLDCNNPLYIAQSGYVVNLLVYYGTDVFPENICVKSPLFLGNDYENDEEANDFYDDLYYQILDESAASCYIKNLLLFDENIFNNYFNIYRGRLTSYFRSFIKYCKLELIRMKETCISSDFTLYDFCNLKRTKYSKFINISETDYLLDYDTIEEQFYYFHDIILIKIKDNKVQKRKHDLCQNLERIVLKPMVDVDISDDRLNFDCLQIISQYLDHQQLYNLFLASFL